MSKTICVYPIIAALHKAYEVGNGLSQWFACNHMQQRYLDNGECWKQDLTSLSEKELGTIASFDADDINAFLKNKGFDITLKPFSDPDDFGIASLMKVVANWCSPGKSTFLKKDSEFFPAAQLEDGVTYTKVNGYPNPIAKISAENRDLVYLTKANNTSLDDLDLLSMVILLSNGSQIYDYGNLIFPKVKHNTEVDISFFKGMGFKGKRRSGGVDFCRVKEAKAQTKFEMDHLGAKAESAAAFGMSFERMRISKPSMVIDDTFYVWMTRKGMSVPYFAGCIDSSDWEDPNPK